ncbi:metallophosphoesterase [Arhodomonas sp. SL1]|uniref:metallophosphoesterase n=1 Tax=Arhodomonas sp. SL1 TaxID=3425691 RepID=UPI003F885350
MIVQRLPANEHGRDFVVGDIHAAVTRLRERLKAIDFHPDRDRLLCVGDLVDRGPEPHLVPGLLAEPWFHAVRGNHDVSVLHALGREGSPAGLPYRCEDHHWIHELSADATEALLDGLQALPWALEVGTPEGTVGVVHAEVPPEYPTWAEFVDAMADPDLGEEVRYQAIWSREIAGRARGRGTDAALTHPLPDVLRVFHGHTLMHGLSVLRVANRFWIETGGWLPDAMPFPPPGRPRFTLVDICSPG